MICDEQEKSIIYLKMIPLGRHSLIWEFQVQSPLHQDAPLPFGHALQVDATCCPQLTVPIEIRIIL